MGKGVKRLGPVLRRTYQVGKVIQGVSQNLAKRYKKGPSLRGSRRTVTRSVQRNIVTVRPSSAGSTFSSYKKYFKPQRGLGFLHKLAVPRTFTKNQGETLKIAQNSQNYHAIRYFHDNDMTAMFNMVTSGMDGSTASGAGDLRIYLDTGHMEYLITNGANTNLFVDIFELTCRRDQNLGSATSSTTLAISTSDPRGAIDQGLYELNAALTVNSLGFSPFQSKQFTSAWKCDKWIALELQPGKTHKHQSVTQIRRYITKDRTSENQNYKNLTRAILIRARGQPVCDATVDTNVALSEGELQIVMIRKLNMLVGSNPTGIATVSNNLVAVTTSTYNEDTGSVEAYTHA